MNDFFFIYDLNFNKVELPADDLGYGLRGLDLIISATAEEVTEQTMPGVPGNIPTGYRDSDREMSIRVRLRTMDATDFRLKRDLVYAFFKRLGTFYVAEKQQGNKLMKVRVVDSYRLERPENNRIFATADIPLKIIGQPYWISRFKSMELHNNNGVPFNGHWSYGMGLDVDPTKLKYQFSNLPSFMVYNAGTRPLKTIQEKDNCIITLTINQSVTNFKLIDATGRYFEYNPTREASWALVAGNKIILNGHSITMNNTTILERTNRYFINILPEENTFKIEGLSNYTISFDYRFKYD